MHRQDIKNAVKKLLSNVPNVGEIYTGKPKMQQKFPAIVIHLPKSDEVRVSASATNGKKKINYTCHLEIYSIDSSPDGLTGQAQFDDLLDNVDNSLRSDVTLGGVVLASTIEFIKTTVVPPQLINGQNVGLLALKSFDITVYVTG